MFSEVLHGLAYFSSENNHKKKLLLGSESYLKEIIHLPDPWASDKAMNDAKKAKIKGLMKRRTSENPLKEEFPLYGNVLPTRFVLAIKSADGGNIEFKVRL